MHVEKLTFSVGRTMPIYPLSLNRDDEYANIKPFASVTIAFDADEANLNKAEFKKIVEDAFDKSAKLAFEEIYKFGQEFRELFKKD